MVNFKCPSCLISLLIKELDFWSCSNCKNTYPIIENGLPILCDNAQELIGLTYWYYLNELEEQKRHIKDLDNSKNPVTKIRNKALKKALSNNLKLIDQFKKSIEELVEPDGIFQLQHKQTETLNYITSLDYLKRDWTFRKEFESEINNILRHLISTIDSFSKIKNDPTVLVLGAGTGRIAYELAKFYPNILALDKSISMGKMFLQVQKGNILFYETTFKNCPDECITELIARPGSEVENYGRIQYIIGDANNLPFRNESIDLVISVFFTDVVYFDPLIIEIRRVLCNNGGFVHIGPLNYHFKNVSFMYSYEDLKKIMNHYNFRITKESSFMDTHCKNINSKTRLQYFNWVLGAQKKPRISEITLDSIVAQKNSFDYMIKGKLYENVEDDMLSIFIENYKTLENKSFILDFIRNLDGTKSVREILEMFKGYDNDDINSLLKCLHLLEVNQIIEMVS